MRLNPWKPSSVKQKQSQENVTSHQEMNIDKLLQMRMLELLLNPQQQAQSMNTVHPLLSLWRILASHVLLLLVGIGGAYYMNQEHDLLKSYVGCRPTPDTFSEMFQPENLPLPNEPEQMSESDWVDHLMDENAQLRIGIWNRDLDRNTIRSKCGN